MNPQEEKIEHVFVRIGQVLNVIAAAWLVLIALLLIIDVVNREFLVQWGIRDDAFVGVNELVSNSVVSILLLQLPLALMMRSNLRTTIIYAKTGRTGKGVIDTVSYLLGALLFMGIVLGGWETMLQSYGYYGDWANDPVFHDMEMEGSGAVTIPVYPVRTIVVFVSGLCLLFCLFLAFLAVRYPGETFEEADAKQLGA